VFQVAHQLGLVHYASIMIMLQVLKNHNWPAGCNGPLQSGNHVSLNVTFRKVTIIQYFPSNF